jgi:hypothetical protein
VAGVLGEGEEADHQEKKKDQNGHGSNHAPMKILPGVADMP